MSNKKKQTAVVAIALVLSVATIASPQPVMAQENSISPAIVQENGQPAQKQAPRLGGNNPTTYATGDVEINETNFPDEAFRTWLKEKKYGSDGIITQAEIATITEIHVEFKSKITDLTGIENFTALTHLYCNNAGIKALNVSKNTALTYLNCNNTAIGSLDVSQNKALTYLDCSYTKIGSLDVSNNTALMYLYCNNTGIESLNVSQNTVLVWLYCNSTGIKSLDVSYNTALKQLYCDNTEIESLNVNKNTALTTLYCCYTKIESLNVSQNTALDILNCSSTGITSLDVSNNAALTTLSCSLTSLAYLNIGDNSRLTSINKITFNPVSLEMREDRFNVENTFPGIDKSKISSVEGATYDRSTGVMSGYNIGTPITYTYNCSTSSNTAQTMNVTLNLTDSRADSTISITADLGKTYNGTAVASTSIVTTTGSTGAVSYKWEQKKTAAEWEEIDSAPTDAGTYRVTATLAADSNYKSASDTKEFTIAQAEPNYTVPMDLEATYGQTLADVTLPTGFRWSDAGQSVGNAGTNTFTATFTPDDTKNYKTVEDISVTLSVKKADNAQTGTLSIDGWTYGNTPGNASAGFRFGTPRFLYSDRADGTYTDTLPTSAGTWYVKAVVDGTDNYEGAESEPVSFVIAPQNAGSDSQMTVPEITADTDFDKLIVKDGDTVLVQGRDYDVVKTQNGKKVTVTITFKGNYTGTISRTYTVEDKASSDGAKDQNNNKNGAPQTGDTNPVGLWAALMALSAGVAVFLKKKKRKEETEQ